MPPVNLLDDEDEIPDLDEVQDGDDEDEEVQPRKPAPKAAASWNDDDDYTPLPKKQLHTIAKGLDDIGKQHGIVPQSWDTLEDDEPVPAAPKKKKNPLYVPEAEEDTIDTEDEGGVEYETFTKEKPGFTYLRIGDTVTKPDGTVQVIQKNGAAHAPVGSVIRKRVQALSKQSAAVQRSKDKRKLREQQEKQNPPETEFKDKRSLTTRQSVWYPKGLDKVGRVTSDEIEEVKKQGGGTAALRNYFEDEGAAAVIKFLRTLEQKDPVNFLKKYKEFAPFFMAKVATEDIKKIRAMDKADTSGVPVNNAKPITSHTITVRDMTTGRKYEI